MTNPGIYQLFVYGSLRSGFKNPVYEYISRFFTFAGKGKVKGKLFDLGPYSAGVPTNEDRFITGELYFAKHESEFSWAIAQLDDYEGVLAEPGEQTLYRRELVTVYINDQASQSWIYWYHGDVSNCPLIESGDLFEYLQQKK
jgi:gamma-glutamylcyclotransferase (GGCT)/AIG2-like uncharacterized protein YtfP